MPKHGRRAITGILIFAFLLRLGWALAQPRSPEAIARLPDQQEYLSLGRNLLAKGELNFVDLRFNQTIWAYRMPGYPAVIAACGGSILVIRVLQCLIDTSSVLAVYLIALRIRPGSEPVAAPARPANPIGTALAAASLIAVNPFFIYFSGLILSETVFTALLIWGIYLLICRRPAVATLCLVAACYVRPAAVVVAPVVAFIAMANPASGASYRLLPALGRSLISSATIGLAIAVALAPWAWRNHQRLGTWVWTTTNSGVTLYDGFNPAATGASNQRILADLPEIRSMNEVERSHFLSDAARRWIGGHLTRLPMLSLRKILRSWSPVPLSVEFGKPIYRIGSAVYAVPFDLLCLIGLFSRKIDRGAKTLMISPAVLITMIEIMSVGSIRYRVPAEAALAVLAGVGAWDLLERCVGRGSRVS